MKGDFKIYLKFLDCWIVILKVFNISVNDDQSLDGFSLFQQFDFFLCCQEYLVFGFVLGLVWSKLVLSVYLCNSGRYVGVIFCVGFFVEGEIIFLFL